jgi:AcrR family transcriptional regulator
VPAAWMRRGSLTPEIIADVQRARVAESLAAMMVDRPYGKISVAQILRRAHTTPQTFSALFDGKDDCLLAARRIFADGLGSELGAAWQSRPGWPAKVRATIAAALAFAAAHPAAARFLAVGVQEGGPAARASHADSLDRLAAKLREGRRHYPKAARFNRFAERVLVAGSVSLIGERLRDGGAERLPELEPGLAEVVLAPYVGLAEARRLARG